ncbi:hypothetical protein DFH11DRAFT_463895 [Phellopilus nigrolimitatus]|nr:hypothetical protein DFH11DRAFT_463895 [Phellopilus nigrolimitatus]
MQTTANEEHAIVLAMLLLVIFNTKVRGRRKGLGVVVHGTTRTIWTNMRRGHALVEPPSLRIDAHAHFRCVLGFARPARRGIIGYRRRLCIAAALRRRIPCLTLGRTALLEGRSAATLAKKRSATCNKSIKTAHRIVAIEVKLSFSDTRRRRSGPVPYRWCCSIPV